ncbi:GNAT family N-acetyltransferase [Paenibacillus taichungensis]|uniref:GNAT family N-acetyltransferase n=1 Tax=Paenibacillus taichungensis TaxID=484184 RepID=A0ABX2MUE5_9BACL|nr:GNAT family N-acetyltransferase [Paenibacillus taichungensis]NUU57716.1 GNAT family N-acetyltransferase [Paenibacillus taichungensis]
MIYCREARIGDGEGISQLSHQLGYTSTTEEIIERLNRLSSMTDHFVCVAEIDSLVVGWGHVQGRHSIESVPFAEIGGLVVDEHHRGAGIGKKIMSECEKWARMNGFNKIRVRSSGKREAAHRFYVAIGYEEKKWQKVFDKSL